MLNTDNLSNRKAALFACNSGGSAEECFNKMKKEMNGCDVIASLELANPGKDKRKEDIIKMDAFCSSISKSISLS